MSRIRGGNHVFVTWVGTTRRSTSMHVFRDGKVVLKWDLDRWRPMAGRPGKQVLSDRLALRKEGRL